MSAAAFSLAPVLAASGSSTAFSDILEVVGIGAAAGVGLSLAFALMLRGFIVAGVANREGARGRAMANGAMGVVFAVVCSLAVVGGLASMLHR